MPKYTYRTFNRKRYRKSDTSWKSKVDAKNHAKHLRSIGYKVRVTQSSDGRYVTWARE